MIKHKKRWIIALVVVTLIVGIPLSLRGYRSHQASELVNELRSSGEPTTFADILERYQKPPHNATHLWLEAFELLETIGDEDLEILNQLPYVGFADDPTGGSWEHIEVTENYLLKRAEVSEFLHRAAEMDGTARYPLDTDLGFNGMMFPDEYLDAHYLLQMQTHYYAFKKDARKTAEAIHSRLALAMSLENGPGSVPQFMRWSIDALALRDLSNYFSVLEFTDAELLKIQSKIRSAQYHRGFTLQCRALRAKGISLFQDSDSAQAYFNNYNELMAHPNVQLPKLMFGLEDIRDSERTIWSFTRPWDFLLFVRTTNEMVAASECSWPQAFDRACQIEKNLNNEMNSENLRGTYLLTRMLVKSPKKLFAGVGRIVAINRVFDAAIAVELYRRHNGEMPRTLDEVVPDYLLEVPTDPFSGGQVLYITEKDGFVVYSVGRDRVDNGGDGDQLTYEPDLVCRFRLAE